MTKEEAITYIIPAIKKYWNDKICDDIIKTLKQETVLKKSYEADYIDGFKAGYSQARFDLGQELCDNAIIRQSESDDDLYICKDREDNKLILDKIKEDIHATAEMHEDGTYYLRDEWVDEIFEKYER